MLKDVCDCAGSLAVMYMGTDPPQNVVEPHHKGEIDYAEVDAEHRRLQALIQGASSDVQAEPTERLQISSHVSLSAY